MTMKKEKKSQSCLVNQSSNKTVKLRKMMKQKSKKMKMTNLQMKEKSIQTSRTREMLPFKNFCLKRTLGFYRCA